MKFEKLSYILIFLLNLVLIQGEGQEEILDNIYHGVEKLKSSNCSSNFNGTIKQLYDIYKKDPSDPIFCQTCAQVMNQIISHRQRGSNKESMRAYFQKLCNAFTDWGPIACTGYIDIELDTVLYIIDNKSDLTGERVCSITFQYMNCKDPNASRWEIAIPHSNQIIKHSENDYLGEVPLKVLHLTDFHYDPQYKPGSNAVCDLPLCCEEDNGPATNLSNAAGYWGDYHVCDTPWHSLTTFMKHLKTYHEHFDLVYYTGDIISHKSWATTKDHNVQAIKDIFKLLKDTFQDTPVYPILGNHEPHPTDFYSPGEVANSKISTQWIFDLAAKEWERWLPPSTKTTILKGGYYTFLVRPGFRIIALNSNVCFTSNLWLLYENEDPYDQLKWLVKVLIEAERNNEKVHILSHIPPGELRCLERWTFQFRRIINRFAPIISAQFNGHTHLDELRLFYNPNNQTELINVAFNGGSFTTFVGLNPNYRVYSVDTANLQVLDYDHYTFNLTEANLQKSQDPRWYKIYSLKEAYNLKGTKLTDFEDLVNRMSNNKSLVQDYFRYQVRESAPEMANGCNDDCLKRLLCSITAVQATESYQCQQL